MRGIYLFMPRAFLALSVMDSPPLCESFSLEALSAMLWPVDFWSSGTASLDVCQLGLETRMGGT